jgi:uncharacterized protein (DUF362 family)
LSATHRVAIVKDPRIVYSVGTPFHPPSKYPEYPFAESGGANPVYEAVRSLLIRLGLDRERQGSPSWNPLGEVVRPGDTVLLKPNLVRHYNPTGDLDCLFTQGSVIRAALDYASIALQGRGRLLVGDAPVQDADFGRLVEYTGLDKVAAFYRKEAPVPVELLDFRQTLGTKDQWGFISRCASKGDPPESVAIDLGPNSELAALSETCERFRVTNYDRQQMLGHHNHQKHEYLIAKQVLEADVIVNLPKIKTHRKVGMTCAMKNMVGINASKDCLPHHRFGSVEEGGDEYLHKSLRKRLATRLAETRDVARSRVWAGLLTGLEHLFRPTEILLPYRDAYREGSWYGNDTLPRTVADLNRILAYADKNGVLREQPQRRLFVVVDGIVAGQAEGPLHPSPRHCGLLVAGQNNVAVDLVCSRLMGFDYRKIPQFKYAMGKGGYSLFEGQPEDLEIRSDGCDRFDKTDQLYGETFIPASGWVGHIELR